MSEQLRFCRTLIEHGLQAGSPLNEALVKNLPTHVLSGDVIVWLMEASFPMLLCSLYVKVAAGTLQYKL